MRRTCIVLAPLACSLANQIFLVCIAHPLTLVQHHHLFLIRKKEIGWERRWQWWQGYLQESRWIFPVITCSFPVFAIFVPVIILLPVDK